MSADGGALFSLRLSQTDATHRRLDQYIPRALLEEADLTKRVESAFQTLEGVRRQCTSCRERDGTLRNYCYSVVPVIHDGGAEEALLILEDITGRARLTEEAGATDSRTAAQVFHAHKLDSLAVMADGLAHEIRNPLAICSSAAQFLLEDGASPEMVRECAERIVHAVRRASFIIESLLRFARPARQDGFARHDLVAVLSGTLYLVAGEGRTRGIDFVSHLPAAPVYVRGNDYLLQHLFVNIFFNAFKAMPKGGTLEVGLSRRKEAAVMTFRDTGCGISKGNIGKIFDPLFTTNSASGGAGLGLSLCYSIARQHGGSIEVESVEGAGSTFTVRLPVAESSPVGRTHEPDK